MQDFKKPPPSARPAAYYLMLNGYLNRDYVAQELEELARKGVSGLCIFDMGGRGDRRTLPPDGPAFMSEPWLDQFEQIIRQAAELGMDTQLAVSSSWDMGASWVKPEEASMALYHSVLDVEGPQDLNVTLPFPEVPSKAPRDEQGRLLFHHEVAVLAIPVDGNTNDSTASLIKSREAIVELTPNLSEDGQLQWTTPAGQWRVLRFVCANTGEQLKVPSPASNGLATDHFNSGVTRSYIKYITDRLQARLGDLRQTALKQLYLPSYEVRGRVWTPDLSEQFQRYRQYDLTPYLPALIGYTIEDEQTTQDFLYDFRKTMGDLLVDAYYRAASEAARQAGLGIEAEAGGPGPPVHQVPVDSLKALAAIDEIRGEFWPWRLDNDPLWVVKETACAAHVYGRQRVHMEAFTGFYHWESGPFDLKFSADRAFCEGMNHVVWHTSSHQPPEAGQPGWVYGAGTHLTPNLVWWPLAKPFVDYLSRCSFMLQQGLFVADVCYYYGDQGYNFIPPKHVSPSLGYGYDYDVANPDVILNRMSVKNGRLVLPDGMSYEILALPDREDMDLAVLQKVVELVKAGATVIGPKPVRANGLLDRPVRDRQIKQLADELWGSCDGRQVFENQHGAGKVIWGHSLREALKQSGIGADFQFTSASDDADLDFIHRRAEVADIYFIQNRKKRWEQVTAKFRVFEKSPEIWSPESGLISKQLVFESTPEGIRLPLQLAPWDSVFVVFQSRPDSFHATAVDPHLRLERVSDKLIQATAFKNGSYRVETANGHAKEIEFTSVPPELTITGPWQVQFTPEWGAPESVRFDELKSWTDHQLEGVRHYSGIARYPAQFDVPASWTSRPTRLFLDLGQLWAVGEVYLNNQSLGIVWKPPFRIEITDAVCEGRNHLEIAVANTWANRLIGDAQLPNDQRRTRTNITRSGGKTWKEKPLIPSGLFGPVKLIPGQTRTIELEP